VAAVANRAQIRTPLNAVIGVSRLLRETPLSGEQGEMVDTVRHSSECLLTLINDILDFSRLESRRVVLESIPFDFRNVRARHHAPCGVSNVRSVWSRQSIWPLSA
jgi:signal transduction histidine kinase